MMSHDTAERPTGFLIPPPRRRRRTVLWSLALFGAGSLFGAGLTVLVGVHRFRHALTHREEVPQRLTAMLTRQLELSADQADRVRSALTESQQNLQEIRRAAWPQVDAELRHTRAEVDRTLTPEQRVRWHQLFDEVTERWLPAPPPK